MHKGLFVTGIDTEIGKTVVSSILVQTFEADYWKPVQSGDLHYTDSHKIRDWTKVEGQTIFPETYRLNEPMSPHASAERDGVLIEMDKFKLPETNRFLIAEGAGGLMVPLNDHDCMIDLIEQLGLAVVMVSKHYLGSINHSLLSIQALQRRNIPIAHLVFNGNENKDTESIIEKMSGLKSQLRLPDLEAVNQESVYEVAQQWKKILAIS